MKIAVCYTKRSKHGHLLIDNFANGIKKYNDEPIYIYSQSQLDLLKETNCIISVCGYSHYTKSESREVKLKISLHKLLKKYSKPHIIIDRGFFDFTPIPYLSVGYFKPKGEGKYFNSNSPNDRWDKLNYPIKPWSTNGKYILIFGQTCEGQSCCNIDYFSWLEDTINKAKKFNLPIKYRLHTKERKHYLHKHINICDKYNVEITNKNIQGYVIPNDYNSNYDKKSLDTDIDNSFVCVTYNSNAGVYALLKGKPVISETPSFYGFPLASSWNNIIYPDRDQFCYDMAYSCWNEDEIKNGLPWARLKQYL